MEKLVRLDNKDGIATLTLNRARKRNAIDGELMTAFSEALDEVAAMGEAVRVVIVKGEGEAFSAGLDINWASQLLGSDGKPDMEVFERFVALLQGTIQKFATLGVPTIAALHGYCVGLGLELALAADFRIASSDAKLALPEIVLGLVTDCSGTTRALRNLGQPWAKYLLYTGEEIDAAFAERINLVHKVVPKERLYAEAEELAAKMSSRSPEVLRQLKRLAEHSPALSNEQLLKEEINSQRLNLAREDFASYLMGGIAEITAKRKK